MVVTSRLASAGVGIAVVYLGLMTAAAFCETVLQKFGLSRTEWASLDYVEPIALATAMFSQIGTVLLYGIIAMYLSERVKLVSAAWLLNPLTCIAGWLCYFFFRPGSPPPQYLANFTLLGALPCGLALWLYSKHFGSRIKR